MSSDLTPKRRPTPIKVPLISVINNTILCGLLRANSTTNSQSFNIIQIISLRNIAAINYYRVFLRHPQHWHCCNMTLSTAAIEGVINWLSLVEWLVLAGQREHLPTTYR